MTYLNRCALLAIFVSPMSVADTLSDKLSICAEKSDSLQRLVCYDKLTKEMRETRNNLPQQQAKLKVSAAEEVDHDVNLIQKDQLEIVLPSSELIDELPTQPRSAGAVDDTVKKEQQQQQFGKENIQRPEDLIKKITAKVVQVQKAPYGELIITLEGGQMWRQTNNARFKLSEGEVITIERGALGSFFIGKEDTNRRIRAKRLK